MALDRSSRIARWLGAAALGSAGLLSGCVVAPVEPYAVGDSVAYPSTTYGSAYYPPAYYGSPAPYYYGPPVSLGIYGWSGRRDWRAPTPPPRHGWGAPPGPRGPWSRPGSLAPRPGFGDGPPRRP
jgi:hypothetical protein